MFQARGQHYCEGVIWQIQGTVKYISMWLSHNHVVRYHLFYQLHTELNSKVCHSVNTVHTLNCAWSSLILGLVYQISGSPQSWSELTLFLPATLLNFPCIATTVDVLCVSVQLEGRKKPNFWGRGTSKRGDALWVCNILLSQQILRGKLNGFPPSAGRYTKSGWAFELPFVPLYLSVCSKGLKLRCFLCKMEN